MLTPEQTQALRTRLETDRARVLENARKALGLTMNRDRDAIGRDSMDESTEEAMYATALRLHDREKYLLGKINEALQRLEDGVINECEDCSEPIGFERLLARPVTTLCIACKEDREARETD
jgi:DnaK suppressor protein